MNFLCIDPTPTGFAASTRYAAFHARTPDIMVDRGTGPAFGTNPDKIKTIAPIRKT